MEIQTEIEQFIIEDLLSGAREGIAPDELLFSSGILDSLGTLRLIMFLEERFELEIEDGDVGDDNFKTVESIAAFVKRKRSSLNPPSA